LLARLLVVGLIRPALRPAVPVDVQRRWMALATAVLPAAHGVRFDTAILGGVPCERVVPRAAGAGLILYLHGGGFVLGSARTHRAITSRLAKASRLTVVAPNYRLAPEYPHPAALEDAAAVLDALVTGGLPAQRVVVAGDSAGAGLAISLCLARRAGGAAQPAGLALISPWADITNTRLAPVPDDPMLSAPWLDSCAAAYAAGHARSGGLLSPLQAGLAALPPMLVHAAGQELLRDDARRLRAACAQAGVACELREFECMWHDFQLYAGLVPEATESVNQLAAFARLCAGGEPSGLRVAG
jgi:monoterpene epsilon-lactone hydrolase